MSEIGTQQELRELIEKYTHEYSIQSNPRSLSWDDFQEAFRANRNLILWGTGLGLLFAWAAHLDVPWPVVRFALQILGFIGHGLIVSATAVLAYEWVSHEKKAQSLTWALIRVMTSNPMEKLDDALHMLLGGDVDRFKSIARLTGHIATLRETQNWAREAYMEFLNESAHLVSVNGRDLATLCRELQHPEPTATRFALVLQEPGQITDRLLTRLLTALPAGSSYDAVSNALIWQDLTEFQASHEAAIASGVTIRRVFVIFQPSDDLVPADQAINTVYHHYQLSLDWRVGTGGAKYEMRFVTQNKYKETAPKLFAKLNFGVFVPPAAVGRPVAFDVREDNLSAFDIHIVDPRDVFIREFAKLWEACGATTDLGLRYALRAERMRRMKAGSYSAISKFDNWGDDRLEQLHKDGMEALKRGVRIRRVFVMNENENKNDEMLPVLRHHAEERRAHPGYEWLFCPIGSLPPSLIKHLPIPYGIFQDLAPVGTEQVLYEAYSGNVDEDFELSHEQSRVIYEAFNTFWEIWSKQEDAALFNRFGAEIAAELKRQ